MNQVNLDIMQFGVENRTNSSVKPASDVEEKALEHAAVGMEAVFIRHMLSEMQKGLQTVLGDEASPLENRGGMLDFAYAVVADQLASQRAFGIADWVLRELRP